MSQIRLYLDEDSRSKKLLQALQSRGVDVITGDCWRIKKG